MRVKVVFHERNRGKGAAVRTALEHATGEFSADPRRRPRVPRRGPRAHARAAPRRRRERRLRHARVACALVVRVLVRDGEQGRHVRDEPLYNCWISDVMTCHKAMRTEVFRSLRLRERGFGDRARDRRARPPDRRAHLRGADHLSRPLARGGQEAHRARRACASCGRSSAAGSPSGGRAPALACSRRSRGEELQRLGRVARRCRTSETTRSRSAAGPGRTRELWLERRSPRLTVSDVDARAGRAAARALRRRPAGERREARPPRRSARHTLRGRRAERARAHRGRRRGPRRSRSSLRPGGAVVVFVPAFEFAMSRFDRAIGHYRRYTARHAATAMTDERPGDRGGQVRQRSRPRSPGRSACGCCA